MNNGPRGKVPTAPSDAQAREKLALYVYEYLLHSGAQKAAQTFLTEIRWEKNISLGEPPGFLHSWWCVFWDLYCAAPEKRDTCEHSLEAKSFHDYGFVNSGYSVNGMPPHPGGPGQPMMPSGMDPNRPPGPMGGPRMSSPRHLGPGSMGPYGPPMRPPMGGPLPPMGGRPLGPGPWPPTSGPAGMSPGGFNGPPIGPPGPPPGGDGNSNHGDGMYGMMKTPTSVPGDMCPTSDANLGPNGPGSAGGPSGPGGPGGPGGPNMGGNGNSSGPSSGPHDNMENIKNSPSNPPGTPREDSSSNNMSEFMSQDYENNGGNNDQNESEAILKIKESMQEEVKRFEKDSDHPEFFMS